MTTNSLGLTTEVLHRLIEAGIDDFQITLDGQRDVHDRRRVRRGGQGTFDQVRVNLAAAHRTEFNFKITLRVHYDGDSVGELAGLASQLVEWFGGDSRFSVLVRPLSQLGGQGDAGIKPVPLNAAIQGERRFAQQLRESGIEVECSTEQRELVADTCYAALPQSLVIRSDGVVMKCTVAIDDPRNWIGQLRPDGTLQIDNGTLQPWLRGLYSGSVDELHCPLHNLPGQETLVRFRPSPRPRGETSV